MEVMEAMWADIRCGRVIMGTDRATLTGLVSSPFGYVPKINPDRTIAKRGRPIHDLKKTVNVGSPKQLHPQVVSPEIAAAWPEAAPRRLGAAFAPALRGAPAGPRAPQVR